MPPPGLAATASARRNHVSEAGTSVSHALIQRLVNEMRQHPSLVDLSTNAINRAVRAYCARGTYERDLISWVIAYADPTGETAVRNVLKKRGF